MNRNVIGTFFGFAVITASAVVASNAGFIPESACFWVMTGTFLVGCSVGIILLKTGKSVSQERTDGGN